VNEPAEAEAGVVLADETPHAIDADVEDRRPSAKLRGRRIARLQPVDDRLRGELSRFQREQDARRIERIQETPGVADQHPAVARPLRRPVRIVLGGEEAGRARRSPDALLHRGRALDFLGEDLLEVLAASLEQVVEGRYDADRDDVVVLRDVPEPALAV